MKIQTGSDYMESLKQLNPVVYYMGKKIEDVVSHPATAPHVRAAAMTYAITEEKKYRDLATATSHLTGNTISRFTHIHQNVEDLVKKVKLLRVLGQKTGTCFQRCVGYDGINAVYATVYDIDKTHSTGYMSRFKKWLTRVQEENIMVIGAMTDPKGDRSKGPVEQKDPDQYVHIVDRNDNGIIIRGAKVHMTGAVNSHEILLMPTTAMGETAKDYAFICSLPGDAPGVTMIFGRQANDSRRDAGEVIDAGNFSFGSVGGEAMIVFNDVFVPWEHVYMDGETDFAGLVVHRFAAHHRANYGACKTGLMDVLTGAVSYLSHIHGVDRSSHVRDKITEMIHLSETLYSSSIACSVEGTPTPSGAYLVHTLLANVCKHNVTRFHFEVARLAIDLAGGFIATMPSEHDLKNEAIGEVVKKYLAGGSDIPVEDRIKIGRLIEAMTGGTAMVESMHGAGSPQAQRIMIFREGNLVKKMKLAKVLAGVPQRDRQRKEGIHE